MTNKVTISDALKELLNKFDDVIEEFCTTHDLPFNNGAIVTLAGLASLRRLNEALSENLMDTEDAQILKIWNTAFFGMVLKQGVVIDLNDLKLTDLRFN